MTAESTTAETPTAESTTAETPTAESTTAETPAVTGAFAADPVTTGAAPVGTGVADALPVAPVTLAGHGLAHEVRAVGVVLKRDLIRFWVDRTRLVSSFVQPLLFLMVLGSGLATVVAGRAGGVDYRTFLFPGVLVTGVMFTAVFSAISIVWDREFGFLREMLVAPVSRSSIVVGKCLGGATVATVQGVVLLALAGVVGVPYDPVLLLGCTGMIFLTAFTITAFGLVLAARVRQVQTLMPVVQLLLTPMIFISGALFPLGSGLPGWLTVLTRVNPLSYSVDAMRALVFGYLHPVEAGSTLRTGLTWGGWFVPPWLEVAMVAGTGFVLLGAACALLNRAE
jgi:ABC-2 type transport system permease protein